MLLGLEVAITGKEYVESLLPHFFQERAVLDSAPSHSLHRCAEMPRQPAAKPPVEALINKHPHTVSNIRSLPASRS